MVVDGLQIPNLLLQLLGAGLWPRTVDEALKQHSQSLISEERSRRLRRIYLYAPPFQCVGRSITDGRGDFYARYGAPEAAIAIADFGLGADSPILLDYRSGPEPSVIYLDWSAGSGRNCWVEMAPDFVSFIELLGLQREGTW